MNKKELQQRGKGLLALMLAFIMMFGTSMTVLAATTYTLDSASSLSTGQILQGGDTLFAQTGSGALEVVINNQNVFREHGNMLVPTVSYTLPTGSDYKVMIYVGNLASSSTYYAVELESISNTPSGGNTGGGSTGGGNAGGNTASPEALEAPQTESGNGGGQPHVHSFGWVTTREATETQDGLEEYKCACGVVEAQITIPASQVVVKGFYQTIRDAAPNSRITCDTKDLYTLSDKMVACLSERTDVTVEITFIYQKTPYRMTIPAGSDYSALLADEDMFYGYFYFADQIGAQIEPVS